MNTIQEVSAFFDVNPRTVRRWIEAGDLKVFRHERTTRIAAEDLEAFIQAKAGK
jgi:excisionase family DNA binding protein